MKANGKVCKCLSITTLLKTEDLRLHFHVAVYFRRPSWVCARKVLITVAFSARATAEGCFHRVPSLAVLRQSPLLFSTNTRSLSAFELDSLRRYVMALFAMKQNGAAFEWLV